jgi:hypothetical protein
MTVMVFILACVGSWLVATMVGLLVATSMGAGEEFIAVLFLIEGIAIVCLVGFIIAYAAASTARAIDYGAALLAALAVLIATASLIVPMSFTRADLAIVAQSLVPAIACILVQWWLIRRRWRKIHSSANPAPG